MYVCQIVKTFAYLNNLHLAIQAAEDMAKNTAQMRAKAGRASYINKELVNQPDPGAYAVALWLRAAYNGMTGSNGE